MVISGTSPDGRLVEFIELTRDLHPYFVATQAHPELRSRPSRPHPLFAGLVDAALVRQREMQLPVGDVSVPFAGPAGDQATRSADARVPSVHDGGERRAGEESGARSEPAGHGDGGRQGAVDGHAVRVRAGARR